MSQTYAITAAINQIAKAFNCTAFQGMLSHQLIKDKIDGGDKTIIQNPNQEQKKQHGDKEIAVNEVYAIDVIISSGEGEVCAARAACLARTLARFPPPRCNLVVAARPLTRTQQTSVFKLKSGAAETRFAPVLSFIILRTAARTD